MIKGKLINIEQLSQFLGVKKSTIYLWVHTRRIPYYKIGRLIKFKVSEIEVWMRDQKKEMYKY